VTAVAVETFDLEQCYDIPTMRLVEAIDRTMKNRMLVDVDRSYEGSVKRTQLYRWDVYAARFEDRHLSVLLEVSVVSDAHPPNRTLIIRQTVGESTLTLRHARHTMSSQTVNVAIRDFELYGEF
jgi:hypothetical protein